MNLNPDDPRLTAYALGELDEASRAEIEAALPTSPAAQSEIESIRATVALLHEEFAGESALALTVDQRQRLEAAVDQADGQPAFTPRAPREQGRSLLDWMRYLVWGAVGVATVMLAVSLVPMALKQSKSKPRELASPTGTTDPTATTDAIEKQVVNPPDSTTLALNGVASQSAAQPAAAVPPATKTASDFGKQQDASRFDTLAAADASPVALSGVKDGINLGFREGGGQAEQKVGHGLTPPIANQPTAGAAVATGVRVESLASSELATTTTTKAAVSEVRQLGEQEPLADLAAVPTPPPSVGSSRGMDPILAKRYGLVPRGVPGTDQDLKRSAAPASGPQVRAGKPTGAFGGGAPATANGASGGLGRYARGFSEQAPLAMETRGRDTLNRMEKERLAQVDESLRKRGEVELRSTPDSYHLAEGRYSYHFKTPPAPGTESYAALADNPFREVTASPLSTFSIDVDTASYANVRRFLREGQRPPPDSVRLEEFINYFTYDYSQPRGEHPFSATVDVTTCPWMPEHKLVRVGIKAKSMDRRERPHANLVFLVDVSGSMEPENKLPLVKRGLRLLVDRLGSADYVGIVTYAGRAEVALEPTSCDDKATILAAIERLVAGSGTNGGEGIQRAYEMARRRFEKAAINRIILCTDGDFNVGITSRDDLKSLIETQAKSGVFLSVLGFGMGNTKDDTMEMLADKGNGHYGYVDSFTEARKVFSEQLEGTLVTVAKDVKIQVEFNPAKVATWRLLGYENRVMAAQDFNDDRKDAGEVGAGHTVTALYEVVPVGMVAGDRPEIDGLRYREVPAETDSREKRRVRPAPQHAEELLFLKVRYKKPDADQSILMEQAVKDGATPWKQASGDVKFAAAVAGFGMLLRDSPNRGDTTFESVLRLAEEGLGRDENGYRAEFIDLVRKAQSLK